jgi:hypothetical protein
MLIAATACVTLLLTMTSCGDRHPRLTQPGGDPTGWFGIMFGGFPAERHILLTNEVIVCVDRPSRVRIVEVSLDQVEGGLRVDAFAVRPYGPEYPDWEADEQTLWELGFTQGEAWVDAICPDDSEPDDSESEDFDPTTNHGRWMHLGIQFSKPTEATARGATLVISYLPERSSRIRTLKIPFGLVLCEEPLPDDGTVDPDCDHLEDGYYFR